jgi:hypothetical protein
MAMVNLVFGQFITLITDYSLGHSTPAKFRSDASRLGYVQRFGNSTEYCPQAWGELT